ncbi:uncharacterized protein [Typha angustifolia]|uniref:uncharacterized protein n=1 Tax=Typha angustifolia TaxID=59011 RepID=UPI003C2EBB39
MEANRWLMDVKKIVTAFRCPEDQQVTFATFLLRGEAEEWWKATERLMPDRPMGEYITWKAFTDAFDQKYFPASLRVELTREFTQLKQGNMTVAQYEERFNTLSRFCPRVVPDDAARAEQFKMGLRIEVRKQVNMARNLTYAELVENAGIAERDLLEEYSQRQERVARRPGRLDGHLRGGGSSWSGPSGSYRPRFHPYAGGASSGAAPSRSGSRSSGGPSKASPSMSTGRPAAVSGSTSSGGSTRGLPWRKELAIHVVEKDIYLGIAGHIRPRCPLLAGGSVTTTTPAISGASGASTAASRGRGGVRSRTSNRGRGGRTGRVFAMTEQDAEASNDVATGTMTLFSHTAKILFDPGATHSFISTSFLRYADMTPEPLDEPLFIATPMGDSLEIRQIYSPCNLTFGEWEFRADLLPLEMHDFDLILGIDWLAAYHASINCYSKEVFL